MKVNRCVVCRGCIYSYGAGPWWHYGDVADHLAIAGRYATSSVTRRHAAADDLLEQLEGISARHHKGTVADRRGFEVPEPYCLDCDQVWPCDAIRLEDALRAVPDARHAVDDLPGQGSEWLRGWHAAVDQVVLDLAAGVRGTGE